MTEMLRRKEATEATLAKYRGRPFDWNEGLTCVHLARFHLRQMGHKPPPLPRVKSLIGAKRALAKNGWGNVADMLDAFLPRIAPARMLLADVAVLGSEDGIGSVFVAASAHKMIGWREDAPELVVLDVPAGQLAGAWRT